MKLKSRQRVMVSVHGDERGAAAQVMIISDNQRSIAIEFEDRPYFAEVPFRVNRHTGRIVMLLMREASDGQPVGPWIELSSGGHYEIEPLELDDEPDQPA
jgi:hypothetical protein